MKIKNLNFKTQIFKNLNINYRIYILVYFEKLFVSSPKWLHKKIADYQNKC